MAQIIALASDTFGAPDWVTTMVFVILVIGFPIALKTPRNDASVGLLFKGLGNCKFEAVPMHKSGLSLPYDVKDLTTIEINNGKHWLVGVNNNLVRIINIKN